MLTFSSSPSRTRLALVVAVVTAAIAGACSSDPVRAEIKSVIDKGVWAVEHENIEAYLDQLPDDLMPPDSAAAARVRDDIRIAMRNDWAVTTTRNLRVTLDSLSAGTDTAIVHTSLHWDRLKTGPTGVVDTIVSDITHRELWKKTPRGWRSFKVLWFHGKTVTNGKEEVVSQ